MVDRKDLRKKLPHGYCKKVSKALNITPQYLSAYFSGRINSDRIENALVQVVCMIEKREKELLDQIL